VKEQTGTYPVQTLCKVLDISRSAYYSWLDDKPSKRSKENEKLRSEITPIFNESSGTYDRRRLAKDLGHAGIVISINRVERRIKQLNIQGYRPKAFRVTTKGNVNLKNSPNLLKKEKVVPTRINQVWVTDITYIATKEGWLYLCVVLDLYSRRVIGWSMEPHMKTSMVMAAFKMAFRARARSKSLIVHSDKGGQYKSKIFRNLLRRENVRQSMTSTGRCYDNAVAESFFGTLKNEIVRGQKYQSREIATAAIFEYIEMFYNRVRLHSSLDYWSPIDFEKNIA